MLRTICRLTLPALVVITAFAGLVRAAPARAAVIPLGQNGCAAGTTVGGPNLIVNGDFSAGATGFETDLPYRGPNVYPDGALGGYSILTGDVVFFNGGVVGKPFPGDPSREVPPSATYFYSNQSQNKDGSTPFTGLLWRQTITGLLPDTSYNFYAYFDNLLTPVTIGEDPLIELRVDGIPAGPPVDVPKAPDLWTPVQYSFRTQLGQTSVVLEVYSLRETGFGNDFGMASLNLRQCASAIGAAKQASEPVRNQDGSWTVEYLITVRNYGQSAVPLTNLQVRDDLATTYAGARSFTVVSVSSTTFTVNPAYNGRSDTRLLAGSNQLAAGQSGTIRLVTRVVPFSSLPFKNVAFATATAGSVEVEDDSAPGLDPDPDQNNNPKDPADDLPTTIQIPYYPLLLPLVWR
jgi:hypothetical protein